MSIITFDVTQFRTSFPEFSNDSTYPDSTLQMYWDTATCYISDQTNCYLSDDCLRRAINLMTAHICRISSAAENGNNIGQIQSSAIDKVSVSLTPPPNKDQFSWWLNLTPYGAQLDALLSVNIAGGLYIGGRPEKAAFRKVGGFF